MIYRRDIDYFLFFEDFPHMGVPGVAALNSDGTVNIFINTLYCQEVQERTIKHELRHMVYEHFFCDWLTIEEKEAEADRIGDDACIYADDFSSVEFTGEFHKRPEPQKPRVPDVIFSHPEGRIAVFNSLDALGHYLFLLTEQYKRDRAAGER